MEFFSEIDVPFLEYSVDDVFALVALFVVEFWVFEFDRSVWVALPCFLLSLWIH